MKIQFILLIGSLLAPVFGNPIHPSNTSAYSTYVDCGAHHVETIAAISYKVDISISSNERCVWTIRSPTASSYSLEVLSFGFQPGSTDTGILATCLSERVGTTTGTEITGPGIVTLDPNCPLLVLTYYSGENVVGSRGFIILYKEVPGVSQMSPDSVHYIFNDAEGHIRHPLDVENEYTNSELSTFIFAPPGNVQTPDRSFLVTYINDGLEGDETTCWDSVRIYWFNPSLGWGHTGADQICGNVDSKTLLSEDLLMIHFRSDGRVIGSGFHLTYTELPV